MYGHGDLRPRTAVAAEARSGEEGCDMSEAMIHVGKDALLLRRVVHL
jgi:hypothetical protein